jgi:RNA polymerase sigma factor (sigma-70 family)
LGSKEDAEDVAQEAMVRTGLSWHRARAYADAWVAKVAGGLAIDVWRRRQRRPTPAPDAAPDALAAVDERAALHRALASLSRRQREVVVLRYLADIPERRVADSLGCSAGTVKQHASRGLAALRRQLDPTATEGV